MQVLRDLRILAELQTHIDNYLIINQRMENFHCCFFSYIKFVFLVFSQRVQENLLFLPWCARN
jgi:hypothetical protein